MIKTKSAFVYIILTFLIILLFASFQAQSYFSYSSIMNLNDVIIRSSMDGTLDTIIEEREKENEPEIIPASERNEFMLNDIDPRIATYYNKLYYLDYIESHPNTPTYFDQTLYEAILEYQRIKQLNVTGQLDKATQEALLIEPVEYRTGKIGSDILEYQLILYNLGYIPPDTEMNGTFGGVTEQAVTEYQQANGLVVTGTINAETQIALQRPLEEQIPKDISETNNN